MDVHLTPSQEAFIRQAVESGRYNSAADLVDQLLSRWEDREREHLELLATLDEAEADLANGDYIDVEADKLPEFFEDLKREARTRPTDQP